MRKALPDRAGLEVEQSDFDNKYEELGQATRMSQAHLSHSLELLMVVCENLAYHGGVGDVPLEILLAEAYIKAPFEVGRGVINFSPQYGKGFTLTPRGWRDNTTGSVLESPELATISKRYATELPGAVSLYATSRGTGTIHATMDIHTSVELFTDGVMPEDNIERKMLKRVLESLGDNRRGVPPKARVQQMGYLVLLLELERQAILQRVGKEHLVSAKQGYIAGDERIQAHIENPFDQQGRIRTESTAAPNMGVFRSNGIQLFKSRGEYSIGSGDLGKAFMRYPTCKDSTMALQIRRVNKPYSAYEAAGTESVTLIFERGEKPLSRLYR